MTGPSGAVFAMSPVYDYTAPAISDVEWPNEETAKAVEVWKEAIFGPPAPPPLSTTNAVFAINVVNASVLSCNSGSYTFPNAAVYPFIVINSHAISISGNNAMMANNVSP